jgi:hypothetical protein
MEKYGKLHIESAASVQDFLRCENIGATNHRKVSEI